MVIKKYKMGTYYLVEKRKKCNRKKQLKYAGKWTKKELGKRVLMARILLLLFVMMGIVQAFITANNVVVIKGQEKEISVIEKMPVIMPEEKSVEQHIRDIAEEFDFEWKNYLVNLACCEGLLKTDTVNGKGNIPSWSVDRGLFQINNYWHPEVTDEVAFDLRASTIWTMQRINNGFQYEWMCDKKIKGFKDYSKIYCK